MKEFVREVSDNDGGVTTVSTTVQVQGQGTLLIGSVLYVVGGNSTNDIVAGQIPGPGATVRQGQTVTLYIGG